MNIYDTIDPRRQNPLLEARPANAALANMATDQKQAPAPASKNYKGFVAGVFSGIAKLSGKP